MQEHIGAYNALRSGVTPTAFTTATLTSALATLGSTPTLLYLPPATWTITSNLSLPKTITPWFPTGAVVSINTGVTLTILGPVRIDGCNVFTGLGQVRFSPLVEVDPCWFGVTGDGVTDETVALQKAVDSAGVSSIRLRAGTFLLSAPITLGAGGGIFHGAGYGPFSATTLVTSAPTGHMLTVQGQAMVLTDLLLRSSVARISGAGIYVDQAGGASQALTIERVQIRDQPIGILLGRTAGITIQNSTIVAAPDDADAAGIVIVDTDNNCDANIGKIENNVFLGPSQTTVTDSKAIWHQAGGGLVVAHNQALGWGYNLQLTPHPSCTVVPLTEFRIVNNNFDMYTVASLYIVAHAPTGVNHVTVSGNNLAPAQVSATQGIVFAGNVGGIMITGGNVIGTSPSSTGIHGFGDGVTLPYLNYIGGNLLSGSGGSVGVNLDVGSTVVTENIINGFTTPYTVAGVLLKDGLFTFATLPSPLATAIGSRVTCIDCGPTSGTDATCIAGGGGRPAHRGGAGWFCP
jgi:hypothetical protein